MEQEGKLSEPTWERLATIIASIRRRAALTRDDDTYREADLASALLERLAMDLWIEQGMS